MNIVFDLDGTLALIDHRRHLADEHWPSFERSCVTDPPNVPVIRVYQQLVRENRIEIWSGRSELVRGYTEDWLEANDILGFKALRMRPVGDSRQDALMKEEWLRGLPEAERPQIVFDDRNQVVEMWRRNAIICCQVAPGDF